jgi:hypothetical protein
MATDYAGQYTASHPVVSLPSFAQRMEMALLHNAANIYNEATTTPGHAARAALANGMSRPGAAAMQAPLFVELAATQGFACDSTTTDVNIDGVISSLWNMVAGA